MIPSFRETPPFLLLVFLAILCWPASQSLAREILEGIDVSPPGAPPQVLVHFRTAVQYLSHSPNAQGQEIQVRVRTVSTGGQEDAAVLAQGNEILQWTPTDRIPLFEVRYEPDVAGQARLLVRFRKSVHFTTVRVTPDARSLVIQLTAVNMEWDTTVATERPAPETSQTRPLPPGRFVINLASSTRPFDLQETSRRIHLPDHLLYVTQVTLNGKIWYRLRLGFFVSAQEARTLLHDLSERYPKAWIARVPQEERLRAQRQALGTHPEKTARSRSKSYLVAPRPDLPPLPAARIHKMMDEADEAVAKGKYRHAVQLYTALVERGDPASRREALEKLGLAKERLGQLAQAQALYQQYLDLYPDTPETARVRQRLLAIVTAGANPRQKLGGPRQRKGQWAYFGGIAQYYRRDISVPDTGPSTTTQSMLNNDLDLTARRRGSRMDYRFRFTGGYDHDFLGKGPGSRTRLSSLYLDLTDSSLAYSLRAGRQTRSSDGVFGRFDGLFLSWRWQPHLRVNGIVGSPVQRSRDGLDTHRIFYGISTELGTFLDRLDTVFYFIEQRAYGLLDRRAVGGEIRYLDPKRSLLLSTDYDVSYHLLNTFFLIGNLQLEDGSSINATVDIRRNPLLSTSNALQGQGATDLDLLARQLGSEGATRSVALDRTSLSRNLTLGLSRPINPKIQISTDFTLSNTSGTSASAGVPAIPGTGNEYFFNIQVIGNGLFKTGDIGILGARYADASSSRTLSLTLDSRYPLNRAWRINPRARLDYRDNRNDGSTQWTLAPSLRIDYRMKRNIEFEFEAGSEWSSRRFTADSSSDSAYFLTLGYRADF